MKKTVVALIVAIAVVGLAAPAVAEDTVEVDVTVTVEEIAFLEVIRGSGSMVIDDGSDTFMGNPSSEGTVFNKDDGNLAVVQLSTNYQIDALDITYSKIDQIKDFGSGFYFGRAIGEDTGNILGVWPQAGVLDEDGTITGGGGGIFLHDSGAVDTPVQVTGPHRTEDPDGGFGPGTHQIGIGVSTGWDRTRSAVGEPELAVPDDYVIDMDVTIVPEL